MLSPRFSFSLVLLLVFTSPALAKSPHTSEEFFDRGTARFHRGDYSGAVADLTQAIDLATRLDGRKTNPLATQLRSAEFENPKNAHSDGIRGLDPSIAPAYSNRGLARYELGDLTGALADGEKAIELSPGTAQPYVRRGVVLHAMGDLDDALADFNRAIALQPADVSAYNDRGNILREKSEYCAAIADFDRAAAANPQMFQV